MKKLFGLLVFFSTTLFSQDLDTLMVDSIAMDSLGIDSVEKEPPPFYGAIYLTGEVRIAPHFNGVNGATALGVGIQYNRWQLGFNIYDFQGTIESLIIFPNVFSLDYRYAGPTLGFELYDDDWFSLDMAASFGLGDMIWRDVRNDTDFFRDEFSILSIGLSADLDRVRYVKPYFTLGYQQTNNLVLERVENNEFTGVFFVFGIRLGYFNQ